MQDNVYSLIYDVKNVLKLILNTVATDLKAASASIMVVDKVRNEFVIIESTGLSIDSVLNINLKLNEGLAGKCLLEKSPIIVSNTLTDKDFVSFNFQRENISSNVSYPVIDNDEVIAVINISSSKTNNFNEASLMYLSNYATFILNTLKSFKICNSEISLNFIDEVTGLYNYSYFLENLKRETERADRYNEIFSLVIVRIVNFKELVKIWDDAKIKKALQFLTQFIKNTSRRVDICSVYDINNFVIITPETGKGGARKKVERIYQNIESKKYYPAGTNYSEMPDLKLECAITSFPDDGKTVNQLLDHCLSQF